MNYQKHTGEAYIEVEYYAQGMYKFKKSKATRTGIQGAIRNARVKDIEDVILISKEEYYKEN
jgi:hypothetical protein